MQDKEKQKMPQGFFITGTDTGIGKTHIARMLLHQLKEQGYQTAALKPVASGCEMTASGLRNSDAEILQKAATLSFDYPMVNPFAFEEPIAPSIAAAKIGTELTVAKLLKSCRPIL